MGVMRAARQEKEKVKVGMKEREEEGNLLLRKMQERLKVMGRRMLSDYSRKKNHIKCSYNVFNVFAGAKDGSWRSCEASRGRAGQVRKSQGGTERKKGGRDGPSKI